jgi:hypothetical protein
MLVETLWRGSSFHFMYPWVESANPVVLARQRDAINSFIDFVGVWYRRYKSTHMQNKQPQRMACWMHGVSAQYLYRCAQSTLSRELALILEMRTRVQVVLPSDCTVPRLYTLLAFPTRF